MPTYVYETTGKSKRRFEVKQSMRDAPLAHDPETGEPVVRVISGGYGFIEKGKATASAPASGGHSCGGGGCGCH
jgi:predicted nucleic acid-binding Zn ribbon protein